MTYDKVIIIIEKDGKQIVRGEVLRRDDPDLTAEYLLQRFYTLHSVAEQGIEETARLLSDVANSLQEN